MKFTVSREKLLKALQKVNNTIGSRNTLPILGNVLIEAADNQISLTTTDLEIRIVTRIEAEVEVAGATTVPAKRLLALVNKFEDASVCITSDERHHAEVVCGTSCFKLLGIAPEDFPAAANLLLCVPSLSRVLTSSVCSVRSPMPLPSTTAEKCCMVCFSATATVW